MRTLRLLMLRVLPRRLAPFLLFWEAFQLLRRLRAARRPATAPRRLRTADGAPERPATRR